MSVCVCMYVRVCVRMYVCVCVCYADESHSLFSEISEPILMNLVSNERPSGPIGRY